MPYFFEQGPSLEKAPLMQLKQFEINCTLLTTLLKKLGFFSTAKIHDTQQHERNKSRPATFIGYSFFVVFI